MSPEREADDSSAPGPLSADEIGAIGQNAFRTWCSQAAITAMPPAEDKHGWDFYLQFAAPHGPHESPFRSCKVQVKTTTKDDPSADITLRNWNSMAKELEPWFVVHVILDGQSPRATPMSCTVDEERVRSRS